MADLMALGELRKQTAVLLARVAVAKDRWLSPDIELTDQILACLRDVSVSYEALASILERLELPIESISDMFGSGPVEYHCAHCNKFSEDGEHDPKCVGEEARRALEAIKGERTEK